MEDRLDTTAKLIVVATRKPPLAHRHDRMTCTG